MLELERRADISVIARMSGRVLTVIVQQSGIVKLVRTVELTEMTREEILAVLFPTLAFVEDHYQSKPARLLFCGMDDLDGWETDLDVPVETLRVALRDTESVQCRAARVPAVDVARSRSKCGMRVAINLASEPFRRDRPLLLVRLRWACCWWDCL